MKKILLLSLLVLMFTGVYAFADESEMFVKTMPITRIYTHRLGYKVVYLKTDLNFGEFYVPLKWFDATGGKGVILRGVDPAYPYFSIFWKNGVFHSVKLYVKDKLTDESWGALDIKPDIAEKFDIDVLDLDF